MSNRQDIDDALYAEFDRLNAENARLRELVREARSDFSVAMPFVAGEHGGAAQRSWHERARAALGEQA